MKFLTVLFAAVAVASAAVFEIPSNEYRPPSEQLQVLEMPDFVIAENSAVLAEDGYHYKTVRRRKYRQRRDVNELPSNEYLPPLSLDQVEELQVIVAPQESAILADDGYHYKTVRRNRYRQRRDVNELPSNEYLPPVEEQQLVVAPQESAILADDGYRYKTVRRNKYRQRRDVNALSSNE